MTRGGAGRATGGGSGHDVGPEFADWAQARWGDLVPGLEVEGVPGVAARRAVAAALLDQQPDWRRRSREEDVDRLVEESARRAAGLAADPAPTPVAAAPATDPAAPWLVAERDRRRSVRRSRARRVLRAVPAILVVVLLVGWWLSRPAAPEVRQAANPLPVAWYADGRLHLDRVVVDLPGLQGFREVPGGVAVRLADGRTRLVTADGELAELGSPVRIDAPSAAAGRRSGADFEVLDRVRAADGSVVRMVLYRRGWDSLTVDRYVAIVCRDTRCREHTLDAEGRVRFS